MRGVPAGRMTTLRSGLVLLAVAAALAAGPVSARQAAEHEVRAAFVYNFTKFIDWPAAGLPADGFRICVIGDEPFKRALAAMVAGESVQGHPVSVADPATPSDVARCQILYVGRQQAERGRRALAASAGRQVLTIGDGPRFLQDGGAIRFLVEDDRVRFDVNLPAVQRAGVTLTSTVLRVARRVEKSGAGELWP